MKWMLPKWIRDGISGFMEKQYSNGVGDMGKCGTSKDIKGGVKEYEDCVGGELQFYESNGHGGCLHCGSGA